MTLDPTQKRLAGYASLVERYGLSVLPNWHKSFVSSTGNLRSVVQDGRTETTYPQAYWPGEQPGDHLEFALKYDGLNLGILSALFDVIEDDELAVWINSKPTGKYVRKIWYLHEFLTGRVLPLPDLDRGNYIALLEPDRYYTSTPGRRVRRQRVVDNLLGTRTFCPVIRRTAYLAAVENLDLRKRCDEVLTAYPPELLRRALSYLYSKETKSSFEIEHIKPSATRAEKFIGLLEMAEHRDYCNKSLLLEAQNLIVDDRFRDSDYRSSQNYIGQTLSFQKELIHYVCPKPEDLSELMEGLFASHRIMIKGAVPAILHAAVISYGFVFMHPFEDGNGRIHRFLIYNILFLRGAIPKGLMFPVSAAILKNPSLYDQSLEAFSRPVMGLTEYKLDDLGQMTVFGETGGLYRYIDMTAQAEALYDFVKVTLEHELVDELDFLANYDKTKRSIQEIVDMPDRLIDLFIQLCLQNKGRLSAKKRASYFEFLTDDELTSLEDALIRGYGKV